MRRGFRRFRATYLWSLLLVGAVAAAALATAGTASAATTYLCTDSSADQAGLQAVINGGGTVNVVGHCLGNWDVANNVVLQGVGAGATLDGDGTGTTLTIESFLTVTIRTLTITGGVTTSNGGGIEACDDTLTIVNSSVVGNSAAEFGGGIEICDSLLTLTGTTVSGNSGGLGGGMNPYDGTETIATASTISHNTASIEGGGIYNEPVSTLLTLSASHVTANVAPLGGGILNASETDLLNGTSVDHNTATVAGGGIFNVSPGEEAPAPITGAAARRGDPAVAHQARQAAPARSAVLRFQPSISPTDALLVIDGSTVAFNTAQNSGESFGGGGGIYNDADALGSTVSVLGTNSILRGNLARTGAGGGIASVNFGADAALVTLANTNGSSATGYLNANEALWGGGIYNSAFDGTADVTLQPKTSISHNTASINGGGVYDDCAGTLTVVPGALLLFNMPNNVFISPGCLID
jgi:hypothetical protein